MHILPPNLQTIYSSQFSSHACFCTVGGSGSTKRTHTWRTHKLHTERPPQAGLELTTSLLWDITHHCATLSPTNIDFAVVAVGKTSPRMAEVSSSRGLAAGSEPAVGLRMSAPRSRKWLRRKCLCDERQPDLRSLSLPPSYTSFKAQLPLHCSRLLQSLRTHSLTAQCRFPDSGE